MRLTSLFAVLLSVIAGAPAHGDDWQAVLDRARGQTVFWNAWGGDQTINDYIAWVAEEVEGRYGVEVRHVKVADMADTVSRVLAERAAGRMEDGSVDLIWVNGENFAAMKSENLLGAPFTDRLPNFALVDTEGKPTTLVDFTIPTDGLESPWGMAQFVFTYDAGIVDEPPRTIEALLAWAEANPGRFTYPLPPDFLGSTFLKQALVALADDPSTLRQPTTEETFAEVAGPLWEYLDALHPHLWREGRTFPVSGPALVRLFGDGEIDIAFSFNPAEASRLIEEGQVAETTRTYVLDGGTIGNTHFVAIPFNATARDGAMVVANFLVSPEAQARKQDPDYWGDFTVLDMDALTADERALFEAIDLGPATLSPEALGTPLEEPHPSWMTDIEAAWQRRYGQGG